MNNQRVFAICFDSDSKWWTQVSFCVINMWKFFGLFIRGWGFWTTWPRVIFCAVAALFGIISSLLYICIGRRVLSKYLYRVFIDFLGCHAILLQIFMFVILFYPFLNWSLTSQLCMDLICIEIKTEIWISASSFIRNVRVTLQQKNVWLKLFFLDNVKNLFERHVYDLGNRGFSSRSNHTKDSKNGTWCCLA